MSVNQLLHIGRRALQTYDAGLNSVAQNVANAESEGYSRRRLRMSSETTHSPGVIMGPPGTSDRMAGVSVESFERMRDRLLQDASREAQTGLGAAEEEARLLGNIESAFAVGTDGSLTRTMNDFWNAWSDVADNPTDTGARQALLSKAESLTTAFNRIDQDLQRLDAEATQALQGGVESANSLITRLADLNGQIETARAAGSPDLGAEDERDQVVKQLSELAPVNVQENDNEYTVSINGKTVVEGTTAQTLEMDGASGILELKGTDTALALSNEDGKLGAWTHTLGTTLPGIRGALDTLANNLTTEVNAAHQSGYGLNDATGGRDFFDPAGTSASSIRLSASLTPDQVAASSAPNENGNADNALNLFDLRNTAGLDDAAIDLVSDVGSQLASANKRASAESAVLTQTEGMERGVSGVSLDEEMANMIKYQQGYAASARIVRTAQEMMDTLLSL